MSFRLHDPYERRRQSALQKTLRQVVVTVICIAVLVLIYHLGQNMAGAEGRTAQREVVELRTRNTDLEKQVVKIQADNLTQQNKLNELQQQYQADIGDENLRSLNRLLRERMASGVTTERLQQIIAAASNVRNCSAPDTKRFIVSTPLSKVAASKVSFGSGMVVITGDGTTAINDKGGKEAWYDPAKPVHVTIAVRGGETVNKEDVLPIHYSVIQGATEYRFTIANSARSYAEVTADQCAYP